MANKPVTDKLKQRVAASKIEKYTPAQMSFWPEERRAIANELARSALFSCADVRKPRRHFKSEKLFVLGTGAVTYTGEELRSSDEDIFLALAHAARALSTDDMTVRISNAQLCKLTGKRQMQHYYTEIFRAIERLKGGVITVYSARLTKALACERAREEGAAPEVLAQLYADLEEFERREQLNLLSPEDKLSGMMMSLVDGDPIFSGATKVVDGIPQGNLSWEIKLNKRLTTLFAESYLTLVDFEARKNLSAGARRLQAYFGSHRQPNAVLAESLAKMLRLETSKKDTPRVIRRYLDELIEAGVLSHGEVVEGAGGKLVKVTRAGHAAQNDPPATQNDPPPEPA
ncbi:plasmid replication initiator TrfA [Massilia sp. TN1-12]|uniref:plasmid replication initiator TrfA n=1 Tax=Massilia paldalensis TaxID=3377675 RepID=UPI003850C2D8